MATRSETTSSKIMKAQMRRSSLPYLSTRALCLSTNRSIISVRRPSKTKRLGTYCCQKPLQAVSLSTTPKGMSRKHLNNSSRKLKVFPVLRWPNNTTDGCMGSASGSLLNSPTGPKGVGIGFSTKKAGWIPLKLGFSSFFFSFLSFSGRSSGFSIFISNLNLENERGSNLAEGICLQRVPV